MACAKSSVAATTAWIKAKPVMTAISASVMVAIRSVVARSAVMVAWIRVRPAMMAIASRPMPAVTTVLPRCAVMGFVVAISMSAKRVLRPAMTAIG
jgi:hypothetical protein